MTACMNVIMKNLCDLFIILSFLGKNAWGTYKSDDYICKTVIYFKPRLFTFSNIY